MSTLEGLHDGEMRVKWEKFGRRTARSLVIFFSSFDPPIFVFRDLGQARWRPVHRVDGLDKGWFNLLRKNNILGLTSLHAPRAPVKNIERWIFIRPGTAPFGDWTKEEEARYISDANAVLEDYAVNIKNIPCYHREPGIMQLIH